MKPLVIVISGGIGSGKSTLVQGLSSLLQWPKMSFGAYVRSVAQRGGLPMNRACLQQLGESLVEGDPVGFCREALSAAGWQRGQPLIIDGARHRVIVDALRLIVSPVPLIWIMLDAPEDIRLNRVLERGREGDLQSEIHAHSTEREVTTFKHHADVLLSSSDLESEVLKAAMDIISSAMV